MDSVVEVLGCGGALWVRFPALIRGVIAAVNDEEGIMGDVGRSWMMVMASGREVGGAIDTWCREPMMQSDGERRESREATYNVKGSGFCPRESRVRVHA